MPELSLVEGGLSLSPELSRLRNEQKTITGRIDEILQTPLVVLSPGGKEPVSKTWGASKFKDTTAQDWIDRGDLSNNNIGVLLMNRVIDVDIDTSPHDPQFCNDIIAGLEHFGVDTRLQFGRMSNPGPAHVLLRVDDDSAAAYDKYWRHLTPKGFVLHDHKFNVELRSSSMSADDKSKTFVPLQTVMPGSILTRHDGSGPDLVVWRNRGNVVRDPNHFRMTPVHVDFRCILRGIAAGVILYVFRPHWTAGSRQLGAASKLSGILARMAHDAEAANSFRDIHDNTFYVIENLEVAADIIGFVCDQLGDDEPRARLRLLHDAFAKLERGIDAKIPGWPALTDLLGGEAKFAVEKALRVGADLNKLDYYQENYIYIDELDKFADREKLIGQMSFLYTKDNLLNRHSSDFIATRGKPVNAFRAFADSKLKRRVDRVDIDPSFDPGAIYRIARTGRRALDDDEDGEQYSVFNQWRGFPYDPIGIAHPGVMEKCHYYLDTLFNFLTCDNAEQKGHLMRWVAHIFSDPSHKPHSAIIIIGDQGVGKTFLGEVFLQTLLRQLFSKGDLERTLEKHGTSQFDGKLLTSFDEVKINSEKKADKFKEIVKSDSIQMEHKFENPVTKTNISRIIATSNHFDAISHIRKDRGIYVVKAYTHQYLKMTHIQFAEWVLHQKNTFFKEFSGFIKSEVACRHFMRLFLDVEVDRESLEVTDTSSAFDPAIVRANLTWDNMVLKAIVEEMCNPRYNINTTRIFTLQEFSVKFRDIADQLGFRFTQPHRVLEELRNDDIVEDVSGGHRYKHKIGTLVHIMEERLGVKLNHNRNFTDKDFGVNNEVVVENKDTF